MGKLIVKKFGGTSVANTERIEAVADNIQLEIKKGNQVAVVLSAMGKSTDELISLAREINPDPNLREYDALVSTGEQISVALLAMALLKRGIKGKSYTAYQLGIKTKLTKDSIKIFGNPGIKLKKTLNVKDYFKDNRIFMTSVIAAYTFGGNR